MRQKLSYGIELRSCLPAISTSLQFQMRLNEGVAVQELSSVHGTRDHHEADGCIQTLRVDSLKADLQGRRL